MADKRIIFWSPAERRVFATAASIAWVRLLADGEVTGIIVPKTADKALALIFRR